ncbi:MAG: prenyltransferase [Paracoccaceae bacterium]|nr:MAG: UbiA family prenyltransferase [Alphaproteobacteria bacterium]GIX15424.1 MAG: prenyltransferase [Paracoccaceae bacterium]
MRVERSIEAAGRVPPVLAVDLDGTLLRTDLLHETLLAGLASRPRATLAALTALRRGRAALKAALAAMPVDPAGLPLNQAVVAHVRAARAAGMRTVLVSASDARLVRAVAERTGLFDEAHGSEPGRNLKGAAKAAFLARRFGEGGFAYVGDSRADLPVWARAAEAVTVGAGPGLRRAAAAAAPAVRHLEPAGRLGIGGAHLRALRPHQWLKNLLVFLPALAAHAADPALWLGALMAFIAFGLTASSVYVLNDLLDLGPDRAHPRKRHRPFAAGAVPIAHGMVMAPGLLAGGVVVALIGTPPLFLAVLGGYYALTLAYSLLLKRRLVIDICALAGLYTLRVMGGAAATGVALSPWMLAFSGFLFLALAAVKRQAELVDGIASGRERAAGRAYMAGDLPIVTMMALAAGYAAVLVLALYIASPEVRMLYGQPALLWGVAPVMVYWISRMVMIAHRGRMTDDPIVFALRDPVSLACGAAVAGLGVAAAFL